jgi:alpha-mannosidase
MISEKQRPLYLQRIEQFINRLGRRLLSDDVLFDATYSLSKDPVPFAQRLDGDYVPAYEGDQWGETWDSAWFLLNAEVPDTWAGKRVVAQPDFQR